MQKMKLRWYALYYCCVMILTAGGIVSGLMVIGVTGSSHSVFAAPNDRTKSVFVLQAKTKDITSYGTAFAIGRTRILTAAHNVEAAEYICIQSGQERIRCTVLARDKENDIAVLSAQADAKPLQFSNEKPLFLYVSNRGEEIEKRVLDRYEIPVGIDLGNSGAPLIKDKRVLGMLVGYNLKTKSGVIVHWTKLKSFLKTLD